jgi:hypothetical protein
VRKVEKQTKVKVRYHGNYEGVAQNINFVPGEVKEVPLEVAEKLVESGQFDLVKEVKQDAKTSSDRR